MKKIFYLVLIVFCSMVNVVNSSPNTSSEKADELTRISNSIPTFEQSVFAIYHMDYRLYIPSKYMVTTMMLEDKEIYLYSMEGGMIYFGESKEQLKMLGQLLDSLEYTKYTSLNCFGFYQQLFIHPEGDPILFMQKGESYFYMKEPNEMLFALIWGNLIHATGNPRQASANKKEAGCGLADILGDFYLKS